MIYYIVIYTDEFDKDSQECYGFFSSISDAKDFMKKQMEKKVKWMLINKEVPQPSQWTNGDKCGIEGVGYWKATYIINANEVIL